MERVFDKVKGEIAKSGHPPEFSRIGEAKNPGPEATEVGEPS